MMEWIVTSSAMILIIIALRGLLKGKISLKLQYGLWALVLIRLLLPFSIVDSAISISNVLSAPVIREADDAVADYETAYENAVQRHESSGTKYTDTEIRQQVQQELFDRTYEKIESQYTQTGAVVPQVQIQAEAQQQVEVISLTAVLTEALPYFWIAGMIVVAVALIGSNLHFWWKLRQSRKALDVPGVPLKVYLTDYVATPCLFGFGRPDIYLTNEVVTDSQMRRHVLAHEMSHYRQGDHIWSMLRCVCLVLHWYNPLVWVASILSKQDAELACDEATIKALGENERTAYGRTLIGMTCVRRDPGSLMLTATTMLGTKKTLKERIALIAKKPTTALYTLIACILVVSLAVGCTFTGAPAQTKEEKLLDRCREAVEYIQNLEYFEIIEHTETTGETDPDTLGSSHGEARYVHSGDDWFHTLISSDWTWLFLEKDGQQYRKDITIAIPEEDIPYPDWTRGNFSNVYYANHCWIMDSEFSDDMIVIDRNSVRTEYSILSVDMESDGIYQQISVHTEVVDGPDAIDSIVFTFSFDNYSNEVVSIIRTISEGEFTNTNSLSIYPGTEEEMSAIIDGIYFDEVVTVVPTPDDPTEPTTLPGSNWTVMDAVLVNDQGDVLETMELTVQIMTWEEEGRGYYSLRFDYPENIHNSGQGVLPYGDYEYAYTCSSGGGVEKGPEGKRAWEYYVGFDAEKECFIVDFDDGEDVYLIGYRSPDSNISDLWDHFQDFIAMRPENFPKVNGSTTEPTTEPTEPAIRWIQGRDSFEDVVVYPYTPDELQDAVDVAMSILNGYKEKEYVLDFQVHWIAFDPVGTDNYLQMYDPKPTWQGDDHYPLWIRFAINFTVRYDHTLSPNQDRENHLGYIMLTRDTADGAWMLDQGMCSDSISGTLASTVVMPLEEVDALGLTEAPVLAAYRLVVDPEKAPYLEGQRLDIENVYILYVLDEETQTVRCEMYPMAEATEPSTEPPMEPVVTKMPSKPFDKILNRTGYMLVDVRQGDSAVSDTLTVYTLPVHLALGPYKDIDPPDVSAAEYRLEFRSGDGDMCLILYHGTADYLRYEENGTLFWYEAEDFTTEEQLRRVFDQWEYTSRRRLSFEFEGTPAQAVEEYAENVFPQFRMNQTPGSHYQYTDYELESVTVQRENDHAVEAHLTYYFKSAHPYGKNMHIVYMSGTGNYEGWYWTEETVALEKQADGRWYVIDDNDLYVADYAAYEPYESGGAKSAAVDFLTSVPNLLPELRQRRDEQGVLELAQLFCKTVTALPMTGSVEYDWSVFLAEGAAEQVGMRSLLNLNVNCAHSLGSLTEPFRFDYVLVRGDRAMAYHSHLQIYFVMTEQGWMIEDVCQPFAGT